MSQVSFIGMVSYDIEYADYDNRGRGVIAGAVPHFIEIMAQVGGSHHMAKISNREDFVVLSNEHLARYSWYWSIAVAQKAFDKYKEREMKE